MISKQENIQAFIDNVQETISNYKQSMDTEYNSLLYQESSLFNDINDLNNRLSEFEESVVVSAHPDKQITRVPVNDLADKEIANRAVIGAIDRQLTELGRCGGWDHRDHDVFLKLWTQLHIRVNPVIPPPPDYNEEAPQSEEKTNPYTEQFDITNRQTLVRKLVKLVPAVSASEIEQHIDWYVKVLQLSEKKKQLVEEWKQQRRSVKQTQLESQVHEIALDEVQVNEANNNDKPIDDEISRKQIKDKIELWKQIKQQEIDKKKEEEKQRQANELRALIEQKRERQEEVRLKLSKWKKDEQISKQLEDKSKTKPRPQSADPAEIMRRRQRDLELGKERFTKAVNKAQQSTIRQTKQKALEDQIADELFSGITRDPTRLLYKTKAAEGQTLSKDYLDDAEYRRNSSSAHSRPIAMSGRDIRHGVRAVPNWCKPR
eukprot:gene16979-22476_t